MLANTWLRRWPQHRHAARLQHDASHTAPSKFVNRKFEEATAGWVAGTSRRPQRQPPPEHTHTHINLAVHGQRQRESQPAALGSHFGTSLLAGCCVADEGTTRWQRQLSRGQDHSSWTIYHQVPTVLQYCSKYSRDAGEYGRPSDTFGARLLQPVMPGPAGSTGHQGKAGVPHPHPDWTVDTSTSTSRCLVRAVWGPRCCGNTHGPCLLMLDSPGLSLLRATVIPMAPP